MLIEVLIQLFILVLVSVLVSYLLKVKKGKRFESITWISLVLALPKALAVFTGNPEDSIIVGAILGFIVGNWKADDWFEESHKESSN